MLEEPFSSDAAHYGGTKAACAYAQPVLSLGASYTASIQQTMHFWGRDCVVVRAHFSIRSEDVMRHIFIWPSIEQEAQ